MANEKILNTRLQLKIDTYINWTDLKEPGKGGNLVLKKGEIGLCEIPADNNSATTAPTILFKVGDGNLPFHHEDPTKCLKWASALAADVYAWAKKNDISVTGDGNAITGASITNNTLSFVKGETFATKKQLEDALAQFGGDLDAITDNDHQYQFSIVTDAGTQKLKIEVKNVINGAAAEWTELTKIDIVGHGDLDTILSNYYTKTEVDDLISDIDTGVHSVSLTGGTDNGTLKLTVDGTETDNIAVTGLGDLAFKDSLAKGDVGLGNVDNTSDINKPVSTAQAQSIADALAEAKEYADEKPHENTAHTHSVGVGLVKTGDGGITGNVEYKVDLKSESKLDEVATIVPAGASDPARATYAVRVDKDGDLAVQVPAFYTKAEVDSEINKVVAGAVDYLGTVGSSDDLSKINYTAVPKLSHGDFVRVSANFTTNIGPMAGQSVALHAGDLLIWTVEEGLDDYWTVIHGELDKDTWTANTVAADGFVTKGEGQAHKVWKTDGSGNPGWRDDEGIRTVEMATGAMIAQTAYESMSAVGVNVDSSTPFGFKGTNNVSIYVEDGNDALQRDEWRSEFGEFLDGYTDEDLMNVKLLRASVADATTTKAGVVKLGAEGGAELYGAAAEVLERVLGDESDTASEFTLYGACNTANEALTTASAAFKSVEISGTSLVFRDSSEADYPIDIKGIKVDNAGHADTATQATQDASGNVITDTYATKEEVSNQDTVVLSEAQKYADGLATNYATAAQGAAADTAVQSISTPVGANGEPNGLKAEKTGTDVAISFDDSVVFVFNCGSATEVI